MHSSPTTVKLGISDLRLGKQKMAALVAKAKRLGITPASYVKALVEDDLLIERDARSMSLSEIMAPVRKEFRESGITEEELDNVVDAARSRHRLSAKKK